MRIWNYGPTWLFHKQLQHRARYPASQNMRTCLPLLPLSQPFKKTSVQSFPHVILVLTATSLNLHDMGVWLIYMGFVTVPAQLALLHP